MRDKITALIHHPYKPPEGFESPQPGVFKASTVIFPDVAAMRERNWKDKSGYTYGLHGTPTTFLLEERLCALEGGLQCVLTPSGLSAISHVGMALLQSGDEVLLPDNVYGPSRELVTHTFKAWGITHQFYDPMNASDLASRIGPHTRLVWLEAAGSVTLEFPDLVGLVRVCRDHQVLCALDNTWGAGLAFQPFELAPGLGVDISVHALTKYPSGGGDVLMGSIITRDEALHLRIKLCHMYLGTGVGGNDAELVLRSLSSMAVRYAAHDHTARALAQACLPRPEVAQVLHPALPDSPGHAHWQALCHAGPGGAAGLFSILLQPTFKQAQVDAFCNALRLFKLGYSWGGPMSLVVPYQLKSMRSAWPRHLAQGTLVRFSVGLETLADLARDLDQAFAALHA